MNVHILAPAAVLIVWTLVMMGWMMVVTGRAYTAAGLSVATQTVGSRGQDLAGKVPDRALWPSHNYTHLLEQPTVFYPAVIMLSFVGATTFDIAIAWAYVGLRVCHSIWQATVNTVPQRFLLFALSSACLLVLAVRVLIRTI